MEKPNYYAVITADVRYDPVLSEFEKLLFGEITALTDKTGYCWARNKYFADLYGKTKEHVSATISKLAKKGYIKIEIDSDQGTRKIFIGHKKNPKPQKKKADRAKEKSAPIYKTNEFNNFNKQTKETPAEQLARIMGGERDG